MKHGVGLEREGVVTEPEAAYGQYLAASRYLLGEGFRQDSMRRFVRRDTAAGQGSGAKQENSREFFDCGSGTSLALGCGGRSYLGNLHFCTPYAVDREACLRRLAEYENTRDYTEITHGILLSEEEEKRRYVIRHLLIRPGIEMHLYQERFKKNVLEDFPLLQDWQEQGLIEVQCGGQEEFLVLTEKGLGLSDYLGPELISPQVRKAMEEWNP